jgi:putative endonuclease
MHYVYVLKSKKDGKYYAGYAYNLKKRITKHNSGSVDATKYRRPLRLVYYEACHDKKDALQKEIYLKTAWGKRYLKNRMKNYLKKN